MPTLCLQAWVKNNKTGIKIRIRPLRAEEGHSMPRGGTAGRAEKLQVRLGGVRGVNRAETPPPCAFVQTSQKAIKVIGKFVSRDSRERRPRSLLGRGS